MKKYLLFCLMALSSLVAFAQGETRYKTVTDVPYRSNAVGYAADRCRVDVYYPENLSDCPVAVWFHGGGLTGGHKEIPEELKNSGLVVIGVNYRLLPKSTIDETIDDAAAAVAWAYQHAEEYNGSHQKLFVSGHSAGGYLTDMVGLDKKWLAKYNMDPDSLAGLFPFSGQCITHFNVREQKGIGALQPTIDEYAPLFFVRKDCPPIVILSGDRELELFGRYEEQAYFWRLFKLLEHPYAYLYEMQGYDHGYMPHPAFYIMKNHIKKILEK